MFRTAFVAAAALALTAHARLLQEEPEPVEDPSVADSLSRPTCALDPSFVLRCPGDCVCPEGLFCDPTAGRCFHSPRAEGEPCGPQQDSGRSFNCDPAIFPTVECLYTRERTGQGLGPWIPTGAVCAERTTICQYQPVDVEIANLEGRRKRFEDIMVSYNPVSLLNTVETARYLHDEKTLENVVPKAQQLVIDYTKIAEDIANVLNDYTIAQNDKCPWLKSSFQTLRLHAIDFASKVAAAIDPYLECDRNLSSFKERIVQLANARRLFADGIAMDANREKYIYMDTLLDTIDQMVRRNKEDKIECKLLAQNFVELRKDVAEARKALRKYK